VLAISDTIVGYATYIDLIRPLIDGKQVISTGMTREVDRVDAGIAAALEGRVTAIVSSGDAGIYAMAGLILEICQKRQLPLKTSGGPGAPGALQIEIVSGIPALAAGAALLGAPLTHDFAVISLSDLLTPWETIAQRLAAAAQSDFVIVLYNPKSKRRPDNLQLACDIIGRHRLPLTPAGVVTGATRDNQSVQLTTLGDLPRAEVGMQTIVFIGNSTTEAYEGFMITPRGYAGKYDIAGGKGRAVTLTEDQNA
jgi:precorrin-3B C17-methyltransferase / cobalt-factor III methyltransferase